MRVPEGSAHGALNKRGGKLSILLLPAGKRDSRQKEEGAYFLGLL